MYASLILVGICIAAFLLQIVLPGFTETFMLISSEVLYRPWMVITAIFLHGDIAHLFYNMFALALFGTILESIIGQKKFLMLFFGTGILASIGSLFLYNAALGASGAIFGVLGALALLRPNMQVFVGFFPMPMIVAAAVWAIGDFIGLFVPSGVANLAHLVGLAAGIGTGFYLRNDFGEHRRNIYRIDDKEIEDWEKKYMK